jgi:plastocyanin
VSWLAILLAALAAGSGPAPRRHHHVAPHQRLAARAPVHKALSVKRPQAGPRPIASPVPVTGAPGATATPTPGPTATPTPGYPTRTEVLIADDPEYTMSSSYRTLKAGVVTFNAANYGMDDHNLTVEDVAGAHVDVPADRETYPLEVDLAPGTYRLYCSLSGHAALGMQTTITVR